MPGERRPPTRHTPHTPSQDPEHASERIIVVSWVKPVLATHLFAGTGNKHAEYTRLDRVIISRLLVEQESVIAIPL